MIADTGPLSDGDFYWPMEGDPEGYVDRVKLPMLVYDFSIAPGVLGIGNAISLDSIAQGVDLGYFRGTCLSDFDNCLDDRKLVISFYYKFVGPPHEEQSIIASSTMTSHKSGFFFRYFNVDPWLPFRYYFQVGLSWRSPDGSGQGKEYEVTLHLEKNQWTHFLLEWSYVEGFEVSFDGILAGEDNFGTDVVHDGDTSERIGNIMLGQDASTNGHHAKILLDELRFWDEGSTTDDLLPYQGITPNNSVHRNLIVYRSIKKFLVSVYLCLAALYHVGCYQKADPSSPDIDVSIPSLTPHRCRDFCTYEYRYVALVQNTQCQCLSDLSWYNIVSNAICDDFCGGTQLTCGATTSTTYASVYRTTANMPFPEIQEITNCEVVVQNHYEEYGVTVNQVDINKLVNVHIECDTGNLMMYNITMGDTDSYTLSETNSTTHIYNNTGIYNGWAAMRNEKGEVIVEFQIEVTDPIEPIANRIIVLERVRDVTLRTLNGTGYTIDDNVFLEWEIAKGTNVTCRISAEGLNIYYSELCEMTGTVGVPAGIITGAGWYTAQISASNTIGEPVNQTATFYVERPILGFALSTSGSQVKVHGDWTITINISAGSNINISVVYSDGYPPYNRFYPGDNPQIQIQLNHFFSESGLYTAYVYAENTADSEVLTTTVGVAGELVGLFFSIENVTSNKEESVLYIGQEDATNPDMYTSVLIEWGDGKEAEYFPTNLITAVKPSSYTHYYTDEGFYYVNATLFNGVSTVVFDSYIRVGTPLSGLKLWLNKHMAATNDLVDACVVVSSGTNINVVIDFKDGFTRKKLLTTNVAWCAEHRYFTQDRYNITAFAQNTFNSLKTEAYLLVEPGLDDLELLIDIPVQVNQSTDIIIQFHSGIGFQYCLILDVGDGSNSYVYGTPECESKHNGSVYKRPLPETTEIAHSHTYSEEGTYKVILNAYNTLSERTLKRTAIVVFCHPPIVKLQGAGMSASLPVQYYRYRSIRLVAYIENKCATPWDITMVWNITSTSDDDPTYEEIVSLDQPNSPVLELPPRTFSVGKLIVRFYAKIGPYDGIEEEDVKYLRIVPAPLVVGMEGGVARKVSLDSPLLLEASSTTYDPDEDYHDPSTFEYQWYYRPVPETGKEAKDWQPFDDSTALTRRKRAAVSGSSLSITAGTLVAGFYEILLMVTVGSKAGEFTQTVLVETGYIPVVDLRYENQFHC